MLFRARAAIVLLLLLPHGCSSPGVHQPLRLKYRATSSSPEILALYEPWFGHPRHISIGYSSHDPAVIINQIHQASAMGISAFVVDWYGNREPFNDASFGLMQTIAAKQNFHVAIIYDETNQEDGATDETIADFNMYHDTYLSPKAPGSQATLMYAGRPVIFIFPKGGHTNWDKVRAVVNKWDTPPWLIYENDPGQYANVFDGFYAWINPGAKGWAADGNNWGEQYLGDFYQTMRSKYRDKIIVAGVWPGFDDSKASWGLNRHISARCGQTFKDTFNLWKKYYAADDPIPFLLVETWNDYEEGSAIERGIPGCASGPQQNVLPNLGAGSAAAQPAKP